MVQRGHSQLKVVVLLAQVVEQVPQGGVAAELGAGGEDFGQLGIGSKVVDAQLAALGVGVVEVGFHGAQGQAAALGNILGREAHLVELDGGVLGVAHGLLHSWSESP